MRSRSIFGRITVGSIVALLLVAVLAPAAPVGAAGSAAGTRSLTATPGTGLVDLDTVTISGSGFTPYATVGVCEGVAGGTDTNSCGVIFSALFAGPDGSFTTDVQVRQLLRIPALGRIVDCRVEVCAVAAAEVNGLTPIPGTIATVPISFAAAPPPPAVKGTITVTHDTDLIESEMIVVVGTGFRPGVRVEMLECGTSAPVDQGDCVLRGYLITDATGAFVGRPTVTRSIPATTGDCRVAPSACTLVVGEAADVAGTLLLHPLHFQAATSFPGFVIASPSSGLVDRQTIAVEGLTFDPNTTVVVCQTAPGFLTTDPCPTNGRIAVSDSVGTFDTSLTVRRSITLDGSPYDCALAPCVIVAAETSVSGTRIAEAALQFTPPLPAIVPAATAVPPAEGNSGTTTVEVPVHLSAPSTDTVTVPWTTLFVAGAPAGQADPGTDYVPASGTATFLPGQTDITVSIVIQGDLLVEPQEYVVVSFNHPTHAVMGGFWGLGFALIADDDA